MKETNNTLVCARCRAFITANEVRVLIGRFIYCLYCGDEKAKEARMRGSSIFIKPEDSTSK